MTNILQISDTHIVAEGALVSGRLETSRSLEELVEYLVEVQYEIGGLDAILVSGDLSEDGSLESYHTFKEIIGRLEAPLYVIPGNHDAREPMRGAFASGGYLPPDGKLNWHQVIGNIHLIGLDTLIEGSGGGELDAATLTFLDDALAKISGAPVLLALHHPPFDTGIQFMDKIGINDGLAGFDDILSAYKGEVRVICGHIHSIIASTIGGKMVLSAPSPCSTFAFNIQENAPVGFMDSGDGCFLHRWTSGFHSVRLYPAHGDGPFPF